MAVGTHDLAKIRAPFTYEALPPEDIRFVPLKQTREFNARELLQVEQRNKGLGAVACSSGTGKGLWEASASACLPAYLFPTFCV